jgi:hypothetical protein
VIFFGLDGRDEAAQKGAMKHITTQLVWAAAIAAAFAGSVLSRAAEYRTLSSLGAARSLDIAEGEWVRIIGVATQYPISAERPTLVRWSQVYPTGWRVDWIAQPGSLYLGPGQVDVSRSGVEGANDVWVTVVFGRVSELREGGGGGGGTPAVAALNVQVSTNLTDWATVRTVEAPAPGPAAAYRLEIREVGGSGAGASRPAAGAAAAGPDQAAAAGATAGDQR